MQSDRKTYFLFVDDSGSPCPDKNQTSRSDGLDAFALGGFLICEDHVEQVKELHKNFMISQKLECPDGNFKYHLHSTKIRCKKGHFEWLKCDERAAEFYAGLDRLISSLPIVVHACVVDRPNYRQRYENAYQDKWQICRSAYQILIERAVKFVRSVGGNKLIVHVEKTGRKEDDKIQGYQDILRTVGMEFSAINSLAYSPIKNELLAEFLNKKIIFQTKDSRLMQIADLVLYPVIKGGYDTNYPPYKLLVDRQLIIDTHVADVNSLGIKYYCFPEKEKTKNHSEVAFCPAVPDDA